jgi:hypothetical protein
VQEKGARICVSVRERKSPPVANDCERKKGRRGEVSRLKKSAPIATYRHRKRGRACEVAKWKKGSGLCGIADSKKAAGAATQLQAKSGRKSKVLTGKDRRAVATGNTIKGADVVKNGDRKRAARPKS